jgi:hypothetical protein
MKKKTQLNKEILNRQHLNDHITSAWYFNGHIYGTGTDLNGDRHKFDIYDSISQKLLCHLSLFEQRSW